MSGPIRVTPEYVARWHLPAISADSDKEDRGRVLLMAGGPQVAGASLLTAVAALRAGAGKVQICAPRSLATALALAMPEARVTPGAETADGELAPEAVDQLGELLERCDVVVAGPGTLDRAVAGELALRLAEHAPRATLVVDAAAMLGLAAQAGRAVRSGARMVLTPHLGEMAALTGWEKGQVEAESLRAARTVSQELRSVVALKAHKTLIVAPEGRAWIHQGQAVGLATAGSGDVLTGIIAGLLARGAEPAQATVWGVFAHGRAGVRLAERVGRLGFLARELLDEIAPVLDALETGALEAIASA